MERDDYIDQYKISYTCLNNEQAFSITQLVFIKLYERVYNLTFSSLDI